LSILLDKKKYLCYTNPAIRNFFKNKQKIKKEQKCGKKYEVRIKKQPRIMKLQKEG